MFESLFAGMFSPEWFAALSGIILLDLILSGDNAILIALACKNLPEHNRGKAILVGGMGAVGIRIVCTLFATGLLALPYLEFVGGALVAAWSGGGGRGAAAVYRGEALGGP